MDKATEDQIRKDAHDIIQAKLKEIYALRSECEALARESGVEFHFSAAYGMGGWFDPEDDSDESDNGWRASSRSC